MSSTPLSDRPLLRPSNRNRLYRCDSKGIQPAIVFIVQSYSRCLSQLGVARICFPVPVEAQANVVPSLEVAKRMSWDVD